MRTAVKNSTSHVRRVTHLLFTEGLRAKTANETRLGELVHDFSILERFLAVHCHAGVQTTVQVRAIIKPAVPTAVSPGLLRVTRLAR